MCDLHLAICFCMCMLLMQIQCDCQILASYRMQPVTRMPMGASNRKHTSNRMPMEGHQIGDARLIGFVSY
jgi:hypothetical protein